MCVGVLVVPMLSIPMRHFLNSCLFYFVVTQKITTCHFPVKKKKKNRVAEEQSESSLIFVFVTP